MQRVGQQPYEYKAVVTHPYPVQCEPVRYGDWTHREVLEPAADDAPLSSDLDV
jgi:hypothetical protein